MSILCKSLKYSQFGEPAEVLQLVEDTIGKPQKNQVLVKILAAPINPADNITIQGLYPVKPQFPAVGGNECVAEVLEIGEEVKNLSIGQHVVPFVPGLGTWRTHALYTEDQLMAVSNEIGLVEAATITVNPCTAYRMLKDFVKLTPGDCVIQNGANSAVGQAVHQLCKAWGIKSVGIVRDRPDIEELKAFLKSLGATEVLTIEELSTTKIFEDGTLPAPKLAFNCVGGKNATEVSRHLAHKGFMVTYGGMAREPVVVPTTDFIFKDVVFCGYWMTRWTKENPDSPQRTEMFKELCDLIEQKKFLAPTHELVPFDNFKYAATAASSYKGFNGKKFILNMLAPQKQICKISM